MSEKIKLTFPDGNTRSVDKGTIGQSIAESISKSLAKETIAIKIDGKLCDVSCSINNDTTIQIIKRDDDQALELIRHYCAHVMAESGQELFPGTQVTIGPVI